jgi:hypothetical protein
VLELQAPLSLIHHSRKSSDKVTWRMYFINKVSMENVLGIKIFS